MKIICEWCFPDWEDLPEYMGTTYDADCGDGCCYVRNKCTECNGLGYIESKPVEVKP